MFHGSIVGAFSIKFALLVRYCLVIVMLSTIAFFRWSQLLFRLELGLKFQLEFLKNSVAICIDIRNFRQHTRCYQNSSKNSCKKKAVGMAVEFFKKSWTISIGKAANFAFCWLPPNRRLLKKRCHDSTENCCHPILSLLNFFFFRIAFKKAYFSLRLHQILILKNHTQ